MRGTNYSSATGRYDKVIAKALCSLSADVLNIQNRLPEQAELATVDTIKQCLLDDVNGDETVLVPFTRYIRLYEDGTTEIIAEFNSTLTGAYTSVNGVDPNDVGLPATGKVGREEVNGTWSPSALIKSFTIKSIGASTFTDSNGIVTNMADGDTESWTIDAILMDTAPVFTGAGVVTYTFLGA